MSYGLKDIIVDYFNDGIKTVAEEKANERYEICQECEHLNKMIQNCRKCHCFVKYKVILEKSTCPDGRW